MTSETTGGFGRTFGSIAAIVAAIALVAGLYVGWGEYRKLKDAAADKTIVTTDSLQRAVVATQQAADARLAAHNDSLMRLVSAANARTKAAQQSGAIEVASLAAQLRRADSLRQVATTPADTAAAAEIARPPSLDSTIALLAHQHAADSGATALQASAASSCLVSLTGCALGRARADSIATFWQVKYQAEKKKIVPKWQSVTVSVLEALGVAVLTKLILK